MQSAMHSIVSQGTSWSFEGQRILLQKPDELTVFVMHLCGFEVLRFCGYAGFACRPSPVAIYFLPHTSDPTPHTTSSTYAPTSYVDQCINHTSPDTNGKNPNPGPLPFAE
jgi:hypothetical protein